jgi:gamma-glutamyltranspeptidase/glutathione hydrolase
MRVRRIVVSLVAVSAVLAVVAPVASAREGSRLRPLDVGRTGIVATEAPIAADVGRSVLDRGGNAIDALVATVYAIGVVRPQSCGIGGGGFLVYRAADGTTATIDFRETAPAAFTPDVFAGPGLHTTFTGHLTVGVPGVVAGMSTALRRFGTLGLAQLVAPAERLARVGFPVPESLSKSMATNASRLKLFPASAAQFLMDGDRPYQPGETLRQPDLATTLRLIRQQGPKAFYRGFVARRIVRDMQRPPISGERSVMTAEDIAAYRAVVRPALQGTYRGHEIITMGPPTSGGIAILEMLNLLEGYDLPAMGQSSADHLHLLAETQKLAFADRGQYVADPDKVVVPTAVLTSKEYAARRRGEISLAQARTYKPGDVGTGRRLTGREGNPLGSTTHVDVIDADGNAASMTCTVESEFGSAVVAPGTGVLLNNQMTDFSAAGTANEPAPGKRPRSSMSPTIVVRDGRPVLAVGGAGGARIIEGVMQAIVNTIDFGLEPNRAIDAERIDTRTGQPEIEEARLAPGVLDDLIARGHKVTRLGEYGATPRVQGAGVAADGSRIGASDSRSDDGTVGSDYEGGVREQDRTGPTLDVDSTPLDLPTGIGLRLRFRASDRGRGGTLVDHFDVSIRRNRGRIQRFTTALRQLTLRLRVGTLTDYVVSVRAVDGRGNRSKAVVVHESFAEAEPQAAR